MSERYYTHVEVDMIIDLKQRLDELEKRMQLQDDLVDDLARKLRAAEEKLSDVNRKLWLMQDDNC